MSINTSSAGAALPANGSAAILVGRMLLSAMFIVAGFAKLASIPATAGWFGGIGLPFPTFLAVLVGLLELFGGLAVLLGYRTRIAALALAVFTLAATAIAHLDFTDQIQQLFLQKNLAVTGGLLLLAAFGAGAYSLDARR